jgi:type IV secretory pathway TraG/TraD family ATPase VirD4
MQLPPDDEIVMVAGVPPIRAKKARYFEDPRFRGAGAAAAVESFLSPDHADMQEPR